MSDDLMFFSAMTELDDDILLDSERAWENAPARRRARIRVLAAAACAALVVTGAFAAARAIPAAKDAIPKANEGDDTVPIESNNVGALPTGKEEPPKVDEGDNTISFAFNDVAASPAGTSSMYDLWAEDFIPMSAEETLAYFGVSLPKEGLVPGFELTDGGCFGHGCGIYRRPAGSVYYDINSYVFTAPGKSLTLTLRTVLKNLIPSTEQVASGPENMVFTKINGWELALFRYTDENGLSCVYTEFVVDGVTYCVRASGLEDDELAHALINTLPQKDSTSGPFTATGTVTFVDSRSGYYFDGAEHHYRENHDFIDVDFGDIRLTVWLIGEADRFNVGDTVTVTWNGEPATAYNIWPGQLISVE